MDLPIIHHNKEAKTIREFVARHLIFGIDANTLFNNNRENIFSAMSIEDRNAYKLKFGTYPTNASQLNVAMTLPIPCTIIVPEDRVTREMAISTTNFQKDTSDLYAFENEKIASIIQNIGYRTDIYNKRNTDVLVIIWSKKLYSDNFINKTKKNEFIDISGDIISLNTNVTENGGSFSISLPFRNEYKSGYSKSLIYENSNYYNTMISPNDIVFLAFEKLEMEPDPEKIHENISRGVYDMIGLIDNVATSKDSNALTSTVEVSGRDCMKLLIEDGSFFFNPSTCENPSRIFNNVTETIKQGDIREADVLHNTYNNPINRLRGVTGEIDVFVNKINQDIDYIIKGVVSQLANVEVAPSPTFNSWGDERTMFYELQYTK